MKKYPKIGSVVKHQNKFTKVVDIQDFQFQTCAILERKDGCVAAVPLWKITWNGKQFLVKD
jgi:hypothetical protein